MNRAAFTLVLISIALGLGPKAGAGAPPVIPVQGVLTDKDKMPIDATVEIRFSIYDQETEAVLQENVTFNEAFDELDVEKVLSAAIAKKAAEAGIPPDGSDG